LGFLDILSEKTLFFSPLFCLIFNYYIVFFISNDLLLYLRLYFILYLLVLCLLILIFHTFRVISYRVRISNSLMSSTYLKIQRIECSIESTKYDKGRRYLRDQRLNRTIASNLLGIAGFNKRFYTSKGLLNLAISTSSSSSRFYSSCSTPEIIANKRIFITDMESFKKHIFLRFSGKAIYDQYLFFIFGRYTFKLNSSYNLYMEVYYGNDNITRKMFTDDKVYLTDSNKTYHEQI
jgi:hypothetical protein